MRRTPYPFSILAAGVLFAAAACSDQAITSPSLRPVSDGPSLSLGTGIPDASATSQIAINSDASATFVGFNANATATPTFGLIFTPGGSTTLVSPLNVAWGAPLGASKWIQTAANAGASTILPGTYRFTTTFTVPPGATNLLLNLSTLGDNAVEVYLNNTDIGGQAVKDCFVANSLCNWQTKLNLTDAAHLVVGLNTLTFDLVNTRVGYNGNGAGDATATAPCKLPPDAGTGWTATQCQNPSGLDFSGTVFYTPFTPPPVTPQFVIGDVEPHGIGDVVNFWGAQWHKNNTTSLTSDNGWESFKGFADQAGNACGQTWLSDPGNSAPPPAPPLGADIAIIVTNIVTKNGNVLGGNIRQIVIVHQDGNYSNNPGHAGGGVVTKIVCTAP